MKDYFGIAEEREGCLKTMPKKVKRKKARVRYGVEVDGYLWMISYPEKKWATQVAKRDDGKVVKFVECLTD